MKDEGEPDDPFIWPTASTVSGERKADIGWRAFGRRLEGHLLRLDVDCTTGFEVAVGDALLQRRAPYVQFAEFGPGLIRVEVSSDTYMAPEFWLDDGRVFLMRRMNWTLEPRGNWYIEDWQSRSQELSGIVVRVLREVFGVPTKHGLTASASVKAALGIGPHRAFLDKKR